MKVLFKVCFIITFLIFNSLSVFAAPQLEIGYSDFKCHEFMLGKGFNECTLSSSVKIRDYNYNSKYDKYVYRISCDTDYTYTTLSKATGLTLNNHGTAYESVSVYGTNKSKNIDINFSFNSFINPVIKVVPGNLYCKVTNIYNY